MTGTPSTRYHFISSFQRGKKKQQTTTKRKSEKQKQSDYRSLRLSLSNDVLPSVRLQKKKSDKPLWTGLAAGHFTNLSFSPIFLLFLFNASLFGWTLFESPFLYFSPRATGR